MPVFLSIIIDTDPIEWEKRARIGGDQQITLNDLVKCMVIFCNAFSLMHRKNKILLLGNHPDGVHKIFPPSSDKSANFFEEDLTLISASQSLPIAVAKGLLQSGNYDHIDDVNASSSSSSSSKTKTQQSTLVNALSISLCAINKQIQKHKNLQLQPQILIIQVLQDKSQTYNSIMNAIFSAQKLHVPIDSIVLSKESSNFLQQASFLTSGIYQHPADQRNLLQLLFTHILPSPKARQETFNTFSQSTVDFKASCSCHRETVEFAYMCSVCLTLTCDTHNCCLTCETPARKKHRTTNG